METINTTGSDMVDAAILVTMLACIVSLAIRIRSWRRNTDVREARLEPYWSAVILLLAGTGYFLFRSPVNLAALLFLAFIRRS